MHLEDVHDQCGICDGEEDKAERHAEEDSGDLGKLRELPAT